MEEGTLETNGPIKTGVPILYHVEKVLEEKEKRLGEKDKALALQAKEYERRLTDLNHAHAEALRVQHTYLTTDKFEVYQTHINEDIEALETFKKQTLAIGAVAVFLAGAFGFLLSRLFPTISP